ncbi:MAG TPA: hypothetical protein VFZ08_07755 [Terriglobia bacterium]|nr:hypothetical protein [Terriglobia bacterium]
MCAALALLAGLAPAFAWGRRGHEMINAAAIQTLPEPLRSYFRPHQFYLVEHASDPDVAASGNPAARRHHFADIEAWDRYPFRRFRNQFVLKGLGPLPAQLKAGDAPWQIEGFTLRLAADFRARRWTDASHDVIFAAHYAADLAEPLHTVVNYDGQLTGESEIHRMFETEVVDFFADRWILRPEPAVYLHDLRAAIFSEFLKSYQASSAIFAADRKARSRWNISDPQFLPAFAASAGLLAKARIEDAASFAGSLWYTAWQRAGKPDLHGWKTPADSRAARDARREGGGQPAGRTGEGAAGTVEWH